MNPWLILVLAGLLETAWAIGLKFTDGFTRFWPSLWTALSVAGSMVLLSFAVRAIPVGTAYAIWVGIGAVGAAICGILLLGEPVTPGRVFFLGLLLIALVGLKMTSGSID